ncbi:MAG: TonB-dependent receptor [Hymenobacteraceae bacterium]|nr:TonB-dependent receptor [Hymenobacteraceae bacterium]
MRFLLLLLCFGLPWLSRAQAVTGTLRDDASGAPVPFATVRLLRSEAADSSLVQGTQTTEAGDFRFDGLAPGAYGLRVSVIGYQPLRRTVAVGPTVDALLNDLRLAPVAKQLGQVNVTGEKAIVQDDLNKRVINVAKDLTSVAGTAVDVLQNIPSVQVDQNGAISLRGAENVLILVDGKQSGLASGAAALAQIPASRIDRIEVVTNPSARYDADGAGGVINIILKKNTQAGTTGTAALNVGTRDKWNATGTLGTRRGAWNPTASYDFRRERRWGETTLDQTTALQRSPVLTNQRGDNVSYSTNHTARLGVEWSPAPDRSVGLAVQPRFGPSQTRDNLRTTRSMLADGRDAGSFTRRNDTEGQSNAVDMTVDFRRAFVVPPVAPAPDDSVRRPGLPAKQPAPRELSGSLVVTPAHNRAELMGLQQFRVDSLSGGRPNPYRLRQTTDTRQLTSAARLDYLLPATGWFGRLETGAKSTWRRFELDNQLAEFDEPTQAFVSDTARSNRFAYDEWVQAAYATTQRGLGATGWTAQAGVRAEYTATRGEQLTTGRTLGRQYLSLFPSATLARDLGPNQRVQLSYARRVNRPDVQTLNPFADVTDPLNVRRGNPRLRPEFLTAVEAGHQWFRGKTTVGTTLFWRRTVNQVQRFRTFDAEGKVSTVTFINLGSGTTAGAEITLNMPLTAWWRVAGNASAYRQQVMVDENNGGLNRSGWASSARLSSTFQPAARTEVQLTGVYRGPAVTPQGARLAIYFLEAALSQKVLAGDRGTISLRVSDLFDTQRFRVNLDDANAVARITFKRETRVGWIGFAYRFGQQDGAAPERGPRGKKRGPADNEGGQTGGGEG